tara:strand:- start:189 stop:506 length:318 start_codon:yes stop_codon:yes gene_type:complete
VLEALTELLELTVIMLEDLIQYFLEQILQTLHQMAVAEEHIILLVNQVDVEVEQVIITEVVDPVLQTKVMMEETFLVIMLLAVVAVALVQPELTVHLVQELEETV